MEQGSMTAGQAGGKQLMDPVFSVAGAAKEAMARYGPEGIINASIGTIYDDQGQLATFSAVNDLIKRMPASRMMDYSPIKGISGFAEAAIQFTFGQARPEAYLAAIATPGGTGGIRHVFYNYAGEGTRILIPDWYWGAYAVIAGEFGRRVDTFSLFTEKNTFNLGSFQEKVRKLLQEQEHLVIVFNSPAHNPTGFSLSLDEWEAVLGFLREAAWDKAKKITILLDVAYMDYAGEAEEVREFFALFGGLPGNIFVAVAFSMSKAFLSYGLRCGALIAVSSNQRVVDEFLEVNSYSNRANWSNVTRLPQELLVEVVNNPGLLSRIREERDSYRHLLSSRATIFVQEAMEEKLEICPYFAGFFISLPATEPRLIATRLQQERIFAVPMGKGLRLAICSIPSSKVSGLAAKIKSVLS